MRAKNGPSNQRTITPLSIAIGVGLVSLVACLIELSSPEFVGLYDSGVYVGAIAHFTSGVMPYRNFTFAQPPGLLVLLSPLGVIARIWSTHDAFDVGRIATVFVTSANAGLAAWLFRRHGRLTMAIAGLGVALTPVSFLLSTTIKLDPYLLLFVLLAAVVGLNALEDSATRTSRLVTISGVLFGVATLIKLWGAFPLVALALVIGWQQRRLAWRLLWTAGATFAVGAAPFVTLAPVQFFRQVIWYQATRQALPFESPGIIGRLIFLTGFSDTLDRPSQAIAVAIFGVLAAWTIYTFIAGKAKAPTDRFVLISSLIVIVAILHAAESYSYYAYFTLPFLWGLIAINARHPLSALGSLVQRSAAPSTRRLLRLATSVGGLLLVVGSILWTTTFASTYSWAFGYDGAWIMNMDRYIPTNSCVVTNMVAYSVYANRFTTTEQHCPTQVDPYGMWLANGYPDISSPPAAFVREWRTYFSEAQYVVLTGPDTLNIPWTPQLHDWFGHHFTLIAHTGIAWIYRSLADRHVAAT